MVASHLRRAIPPGSAPRDALISLCRVHPFPNIGAHVVEPIHAGLCCANPRGADASVESRGAIQRKRYRPAITDALPTKPICRGGHLKGLANQMWGVRTKGSPRERHSQAPAPPHGASLSS